MKIALARACAAASLCALALAAWLFLSGRRPAFERDRPALCLCLVDASASAVSRDKDWEAWMSAALLREARTARDAREELCIIGFGAEVQRLFGPGSAGDFIDECAARARATNGTVPNVAEPRVAGLKMRGDESRMKAALDLALEVLENRHPGRARLELFVDGTYTGRDPRPDLEILRQAGVAIEWVALPPATAPDLELATLIVPEHIEAGAPLSIACDVRLRPGSRSLASLDPRLRVRCVRPSGVLERELALEVPPGAAPDEDGFIGWRVRCDLERAEPGRTRLEAEASMPADALPENDAAQATIVCGGKLVVGYVGRDDEAGTVPDWLRRIESSGGVEVAAVPSSALARELSGLDVVVSGDVAFDRLPAQLVAAFVERGGGWLSLAGLTAWRAYLEPAGAAAGEAADASQANERQLRALLPLQPLDRDSPPRDVLFVIDGSGSMVGNPFDEARSAVGSLLPLTSPGDAVGVCEFSAELGDTRSLFAAGASRAAGAGLDAAERELAGLAAPGGPTGLLRSLEELADRRRAAPRAALVFVFSDGRDVSDPHPEVRARNVAQRLAASRAKLCVVAVGEDPDRALLSALVPEGDRGARLFEARSLSDSQSARELRDLFQRQSGADRMHAEAAAAVLASRELRARPSSLGAEVLAAELAAAPEPWPSIERYVLARPAPRAEVLWTSRRGDPLLGLQRAGSGACAALAFAIPEWAPLWSERGDLFGPLVRALGRGKRGPGPSLAVAESEGAPGAVGPELALEGLDPHAPAELEAWLFEPGTAAASTPLARVPLSPPSTGGDPRSRRTAPLPPELARVPGGSTVRVEVRPAGASASDRPLLDLPLVLERAPEFRVPRMRVAPLDDLTARESARATAGVEAGQRAPHPAAVPVLAVGLFLLGLTAILGFFGQRRG